MKTRITELFGIKYPIVQGGMVWVSGYKLAASVSKSGGLGLIGAGSMKPDILDLHLKKIKSYIIEPFGVNLPLLRNDINDLIEVVLENDVPIIFTSAGTPQKYTQMFKEKGKLVVHVISSVKQAIKCQEAGCDAVVAEGFEAGGHNGIDEITTFCLIPQVVDVIKIPVIAAGGIADGRGLAAAIMLGAEGVQIGTRFAASVQSSAHQNYKHQIIEAADNGTNFIFRKTSPLRTMKNKFSDKIKEMELSGATKDELIDLLGKKREFRGIFEGDLDEGLLEAGQSSGLIKKIIPVEEIFINILNEFQESMNRAKELSKNEK